MIRGYPAPNIWIRHGNGTAHTGRTYQTIYTYIHEQGDDGIGTGPLNGAGANKAPRLDTC